MTSFKSDLDETLDDDIWKDSFDRLLNKRSLLRELNVLKNKVRLSYNNDSSVETSTKSICKQDNVEDHRLEPVQKKRSYESISTPITTNKLAGPFDCTLSPISAWRLTHFNNPDTQTSDFSSKDKSSLPIERVTISNCQSTPSTNHDSGKPLAPEIRRTQTKTAFEDNPETRKIVDSIASQTDVSVVNETPRPKSPTPPIMRISAKLLPSELRRTCTKTAFEAIPEIHIIGDSIVSQTDDDVVNDISSLHSEASVQEVNTSVVLPPGKWRKSLSIWKRSNHLKNEYCDNKNKLSAIFRKSSLKRTTIYINPQPKNSRLELLRMCEKNAILPFSAVYSDTMLRRCRKIGEGTYGEVFLNKSKDGDTVLKIVPIEGDLEINGEPQKNFEQILPEVIITKELSNLRASKAYRTSGFVFLKKVYCVKGKYPAGLIELWNLYDKNYGSENDHPEVFSDDQLYVVLEVANGGKDLDGYTFRNADQANAAFSQVMCSLAVAEKSLEFEHRDLHCGNILIQSTTEKHVKYTINNIDIEIPTSGILVTIIDYTLSRMLVNGCCYYNDLSTDEELFCAKGDYQYDIYRLMKAKLRNDWEVHDAYTNVLWLHYMSTKLTGDVKYKFFKSKQHLQCMKRMKTTQDTLLSYHSAFDLASKTHIK